MSVAFIGLGQMGEPMAVNLVRSGVDLTVWNRSDAALRRVVQLGARGALSARTAILNSPTVLLMLANEGALDEVLGRGTSEFPSNVDNRLIVHMGTTSPTYSRLLGDEIREVGGRYVEAPVSGSRVPAENGALVGMVAGEPADVALVRDLIAPVCRQTFTCGDVPSALAMKLAVNLYLVTSVTGLVEAAHFAANAGLDLDLFRSVLDAGPMASEVSRVKLDKLVRGDFGPQAGLSDVLMNCELITAAAREVAVVTPLADHTQQLYREAVWAGFGALDMIGVTRAYEMLTTSERGKVAAT